MLVSDDLPTNRNLLQTRRKLFDHAENAQPRADRHLAVSKPVALLKLGALGQERILLISSSLSDRRTLKLFADARKWPIGADLVMSKVLALLKQRALAQERIRLFASSMSEEESQGIRNSTLSGQSVQFFMRGRRRLPQRTPG
ncbi:hypothetical protein [Pseudomonas glycinae]|uniref:Uncharacterized protein n=1 Tax=Pseudomonas glycinae TaxID=1785145 RepID=A0ABM6QHH3_9PSED|nr:hypothetical protein [Pseudomonas glycinae]AUG97402.1 hypothetical protein AWU82_28375 [Pseudomonas glycinae]